MRSDTSDPGHAEKFLFDLLDGIYTTGIGIVPTQKAVLEPLLEETVQGCTGASGKMNMNKQRRGRPDHGRHQNGNELRSQNEQWRDVVAGA